MPIDQSLTPIARISRARSFAPISHAHVLMILMLDTTASSRTKDTAVPISSSPNIYLSALMDLCCVLWGMLQSFFFALISFKVLTSDAANIFALLHL